jgi:hypothetical protein
MADAYIDKGIEKTAINLLKEGAEKFVARVTGLSIEEIIKLKNKI